MKITIEGNQPARGDVEIPGSKNDCLGIISVSVLSEKPIYLYNVPNNTDIKQKCEMLTLAGSKISRGNNQLHLNHSELNPHMNLRHVEFRTSVSLMGALLARFKECTIPKPSGDKIGERKIDIHIDGLTKMGATIEEAGDFLVCKCPNGLRGIEYRLRFPSVGATQQLVSAACGAMGPTILHGIAMEPEILNMFTFLRKMGAKIEFIDQTSVQITPISTYNEIHHNILVDKIQAFSYLALGISTKGDVTVHGDDITTLLAPYLGYLALLGGQITYEKNWIRVKYIGRNKSDAVEIVAAPCPGFPTDFQPIIAVLIFLNGGGTIEDRVFPQRFQYLQELSKMGAEFELVHEGKMLLFSMENFHEPDTPLVIGDIRAGMCLMLAAATIAGSVILNGFRHVLRGYEDIVPKMQSLGVKIQVPMDAC